MLIHQKLIEVDDEILEWLKTVVFLDEESTDRLIKLQCIPINIEGEVRQKFDEILNENDRLLLSRLIHQGRIPLKELCISRKDWRQVIREGDCSTAVLVRTGLAYDFDHELYPDENLSDPRVRYLIGIQNNA